MSSHSTFGKHNFKKACNTLALRDDTLQQVLQTHGYPPMWTRENTFETLVLTILEQQVSLASAFAAYKRLKLRLPLITPDGLLQLTDEELRMCSFTRQKTGYVRHLATCIQTGVVDLEQLTCLPDHDVRTKLKQVKGIGDWTVDIYLIHVLRRSDVFPTGDLALIKAIKQLYKIPEASSADILLMSEKWQPYRTIATMIFWHHYIITRNIRIEH